MKKEQQIIFTQFVLPKRLFEETFDTCLNLRFSDREKYIKNIWWEEATRSGEYLPDTGIKSKLVNISRNEDLILIQLPRVSEELEANYIGIVFFYSEYCHYLIKSIRYFNLIYVFDESSGNYRFVPMEISPSVSNIKVETNTYNTFLPGDLDSFEQWIRDNIHIKPNWILFHHHRLQQLNDLEVFWERLNYVHVDDRFLNYIWGEYSFLLEEFQKLVRQYSKIKDNSDRFIQELYKENLMILEFFHKTALLIGFLDPDLRPIEEGNEDSFFNQRQIELLMLIQEFLADHIAYYLGEIYLAKLIHKEELSKLTERIGQKGFLFLLHSYQLGTNAYLKESNLGRYTHRLFMKE